MRGRRYWGVCRRTGFCLLAAVALPIGAHAQSHSRRFALDTVMGVQDIFDSSRDWPTVGVFDAYASVELARQLQLSIRPKFWRLNGEWELVLDQASLQYSFRRGTNWRVEAGRFPSPVGLGMMENRSNVNGSVLWWHRPYYQPLPLLGPGAPMVSLVSATYPNGVAVSTSSDWWDARAAIVDKSPVEFWHGETGASRHPNVIVGAGVTPRQGLRAGVATSWGDLMKSATGGYRMVNVEGEYAFGYTRLSGEWTRDRFDVPRGRFTAWGWTLQAQQTFTPRLFSHARVTGIRSPEILGVAVPSVRHFQSLDATLGYYLNPDVTVKVSYSAVKNGRGPVDHQAGAALMWARRWW